MTINTLKPPVVRAKRCRKLIYFLWGNRQYARNRSDGQLLERLLYAGVTASIGILAFHYFPFKTISIVLLLGLISWVMIEAVRVANSAPGLGWIHLFIGVFGLYDHWQVGITLFHHPFDYLLFWGYAVSGVLSILRYGWNALIWRLLDWSGYAGVL